MATSQFTIYRSTDTSAPTLNGATGSLVTVLTAILVNGYGSKAAAGWTLAGWSTSTQAGYKTGTIGGAGAQITMYVNDNAPNNVKEARITGYETMSAPGTGTGQFPTAVQNTIGAFVARKSAVASAAAVPYWIAFADALTLYFFSWTGDSTNYPYCAFSFGDFYSFATNAYNTAGGSYPDAYRCMIIGRCYAGENLSGNYDGLGEGDGVTYITGSGYGGSTNSYISATYYTHASPRSYTGTGTSVIMGKHFDAGKGTLSTTACSNAGHASGATTGAGGMMLSNATDLSLYLSPAWIHEPATGAIRGQLRGLWGLCAPGNSLPDGMTFSGTGAFAGKTFYFVKNMSDATCVVMETSNTLLTN